MAAEFKLIAGINENTGKIVKRECYYSAPLKAGEPKGTGDFLEIILMMASAGILKGDDFFYNIHCLQNAKLRLTEQSYSKLFDMGCDGRATRKMDIKIEAGASFFYRPCAMVPYKNSSFDGDVVIHMTDSSTLLWTDIFTAGRVAMAEKFLFRHYRNKVMVWQEGSLIWLDHALLEPDEVNLEELYFYKEYTHQGTLFFRGSEEKENFILKTIYDKYDRLYIGVTRAKKGVCLRVLGNQAQDIEELFEEIEGYVL